MYNRCENDNWIMHFFTYFIFCTFSAIVTVKCILKVFACCQLILASIGKAHLNFDCTIIVKKDTSTYNGNKRCGNFVIAFDCRLNILFWRDWWPSF